jgi:hypothetical protein
VAGADPWINEAARNVPSQHEAIAGVPAAAQFRVSASSLKNGKSCTFSGECVACELAAKYKYESDESADETHLLELVEETHDGAFREMAHQCAAIPLVSTLRGKIPPRLKS